MLSALNDPYILRLASCCYQDAVLYWKDTVFHAVDHKQTAAGLIQHVTVLEAELEAVFVLYQLLD